MRAQVPGILEAGLAGAGLAGAGPEGLEGLKGLRAGRTCSNWSGTIFLLFLTASRL